MPKAIKGGAEFDRGMDGVSEPPDIEKKCAGRSRSAKE